MKLSMNRTFISVRSSILKFVSSTERENSIQWADDFLPEKEDFVFLKESIISTLLHQLTVWAKNFKN